MSKGNKVVPVRLPPVLLAAIHVDIANVNQRTFGEPLTVSTWLRQAAREKLDKRLRSRAKRRVSYTPTQEGASSGQSEQS